MSTLRGRSEAQILIKMPTLAKPIISKKNFKRGEVDVSLPFGRNKNRKKKMESKNAKVDFDYGWYLVLVFCLFFVVLGSK